MRVRKRRHAQRALRNALKRERLQGGETCEPVQALQPVQIERQSSHVLEPVQESQIGVEREAVVPVHVHRQTHRASAAAGPVPSGA